MRMLLLFVGAVLIMTTSAFSAPVTGFLDKTFESGDATFPYVLYLPRNYDPATPMPLVVFLHGAGERGEDGLIQSEVGIGTVIRRHADWFPGLVLMPQCPKEQTFEGMLDELDGMLKTTIADYSIDTRRIYLTGLSMGGYGTWSWGSERADWFAALMPVCGGGEPSRLARLLKNEANSNLLSLDERIQALKDKPIWVFHGAKDTVVPPERSRIMVEKLVAAGGAPRYTEFPNANHNSWDPAYGMQEAITWLFAQRNPITPEIKTQD